MFQSSLNKNLPNKQDKVRYIRYTRTNFRRINSLDQIPEDPSQEDILHKTESLALDTSAAADNDRKINQKTEKISHGLRRILLFWPQLILNLLSIFLRHILYMPLSVATPSFWLSALLWIFWKFFRMPLSCFKWLLNDSVLSICKIGSNGGARAPKRTVLLSCGSTIQTLHLARNLYSSGARVIVFEFEGLFGLARFSTAVDKFYIVPYPTADNSDIYIAALCHIVRREKPTVYVPVCATSPAYYDALAKPHLELLGCASFLPGLQDTIVLDDCLKFYEKCEAQNIELPLHQVLSSTCDLMNLYDNGFISNFRNILMAVGKQGLLQRYKYILPNNKSNLKFMHKINESDQWMIVRDVPGDHYVTCTTVKDSRIMANVTCLVEHQTNNLIPMVYLSDRNQTNSDEALIEHWLKSFLAKVRFQRSINGHISFRFVKCQRTGRFLPLGIRLGVSLPYICYNRSHTQTLCRTVKYVHMENFRKSYTDTKKDDDKSTILSFSWLERKSATAPLDKREALFAYWDPLPYCAFYHFQLPLASVKTFLLKRHCKNVNNSNNDHQKN